VKPKGFCIDLLFIAQRQTIEIQDSWDIEDTPGVVGAVQEFLIHEGLDGIRKVELDVLESRVCLMTMTRQGKDQNIGKKKA
jgi:hypothetical protein